MSMMEVVVMVVMMVVVLKLVTVVVVLVGCFLFCGSDGNGAGGSR